MQIMTWHILPWDTATGMDEETTLFIFQGKSGKRKILCDSDDVDESSGKRPKQHEYAVDRNKVFYVMNIFLQNIFHQTAL